MSTLFFLIQERQVRGIIQEAKLICVSLGADNTLPPFRHYLDPVSFEDRQKIMTVIEEIRSHSVAYLFKPLIKRNDLPQGWWGYVSQNAGLALSQHPSFSLENP